jgi:predicted NAD-dependent protein-ADP-ribosyltransferase YbiA (DUF1768 family)
MESVHNVPLRHPRCPRGTRRDKAIGACISAAQRAQLIANGQKRCPRGSRRNRRTGACEEEWATRERRPRCPRGTRRHRRTGECREHTTRKQRLARQYASLGSMGSFVDYLNRQPSPAAASKSLQRAKEKEARAHQAAAEAEALLRKEQREAKEKTKTLLNSMLKKQIATQKAREKADASRRAREEAERQALAAAAAEAAKQPKQPKHKILMVQFYSKSIALDDSAPKKLRERGFSDDDIRRILKLPVDGLRILSNFAMLPIPLDGQVYPSIEHAYQANKFAFVDHPEIMAQFAVGGPIQTASDAQTAGKRKGMARLVNGNDKETVPFDVDEWDNVYSVPIMMTLVQIKVMTHKEVRDVLDIAKRYGLRFTHHSRTDMVWGAHFDEKAQKYKKGDDKLGRMYNSIIDAWPRLPTGPAWSGGPAWPEWPPTIQ